MVAAPGKGQKRALWAGGDVDWVEKGCGLMNVLMFSMLELP